MSGSPAVAAVRAGMVDLARLAECYDMRVTSIPDGRGGYKAAIVAEPSNRVVLTRTNEAFSHLLAAHVCNRVAPHKWAVKTDLVCGVSLELTVGDDAEIRRAEAVLRKSVRDIRESVSKIRKGREYAHRHEPRGFSAAPMGRGA